ncbi:MAG: mannose-6-phosphate isomerase, class I [Deltaproteobacteria bacterium]|nr:mannose-6-phosphate isomerase, class I [Deltaproteobacteria bacterium]
MVTPWNRMALLKNPVQEYAWGSRTFLPEFLNEPSPSEKPKAELWMGAHPKAPSQVFRGESWIPLPQLIQQDPGAILGQGIAEKFFDQLPFLFKILTAAKPLSIQAHPDREKALEGYDRENSMGIPVDAPHRNYRDQNHKPEFICALTSFWALKGFRNSGEIQKLMNPLGSPLLQEVSGVLLKYPDKEGLRHFFSSLMTLEPGQQGDVITQAVNGAQKHAHKDMALEWMLKLHTLFPHDVGILAPLFLNLVHLEPGQAMALSDGELHAYLEGAAIELMANSDNVLRGGLTAKHIDVPELLRVLKFSETQVKILEPTWEAKVEGVYPTDAEEFVLSVLKPRTGSPFTSERNRAVEILICTEGAAEITDPGMNDVFSLDRGASILVPASLGQYKIRGEATIYKATVPMA